MADRRTAQDTEATPKDLNSNTKEGREASADMVTEQPGCLTVPEVPVGFVERIAKEVYGFTVTKCQQLNSYQDKNYHICVSSTSSNPHVTSVPPDGYVMKVMNFRYTREPTNLYAQVEFMRHLGSHGIPTQEPVPSIQGENVVFYQFPPPNGKGDVKTHAVCLRTFIPGTILNDVTLTHDLCYKHGVFLASISQALEDFHHPHYETFESHWSMNNIPKLKEFVHVITDDKDRRVVDDVIEQFSTLVLTRRNELRKAYIHGDPSDQNTIVQPVNTSLNAVVGGSDVKDVQKEYVISGILDYQDASYSYPLYDLAIAIAYISIMPVTFDPLEVGGHILAGYVSRMALSDLERSLLRVCVAGRLVQSLVMGMYNYTLDPGNEYLLQTGKRGWHVLHALWATPPDRLEELWEEIQRSHADRK